MLPSLCVVLLTRAALTYFLFLKVAMPPLTPKPSLSVPSVYPGAKSKNSRDDGGSFQDGIKAAALEPIQTGAFQKFFSEISISRMLDILSTSLILLFAYPFYFLVSLFSLLGNVLDFTLSGKFLFLVEHFHL